MTASAHPSVSGRGWVAALKADVAMVHPPRPVTLAPVYTLLGVVLASLLGSARAALPEQGFAEARLAMVATIREEYLNTASMIGRAAPDARVAAALERVPRHRFVPENYQRLAYRNQPLPIGHGQTISQPYIVALMTDLLALGPEASVLEIGTGSGYQAAVLAELIPKVYTIEIIEALGHAARKRLDALGYGGVQTRIGDGYHGWPEHAPFDGIMVTAAGDHVPPPLVQQLKPGGRMVMPVGTAFLTQYLVLVEKADDGTVSMRQLLPVRFVPLTGEH